MDEQKVVAEQVAALNKQQALTKELQAKVSRAEDSSPKKVELMKMLDVSEAKEKLARSKVESAKESLTFAKANAPSVKNAAATIASLKSELENLKTADTKYKNLLGSKEVQMKAEEKDGGNPEAIELEVVQTKEMLQKVAEDSEKDVKQKVVDEKEEKSNAKNRWVKNMVLDSIKEKADKKNGVITSEKKLKTKGELLDKKLS